MQPKITNIESLGTDYSIASLDKKIIKTIQVIPFNEILDAAVGAFDPEVHGNYAKYLQKSFEALEGFDNVNPHRVLWHATTSENVDLVDVVAYALQHGYDKIILEYLSDAEDINLDVDIKL